MSALETESKAVEISEGGALELSRALRDTENNQLLSLIKTYIGPILLVLQQAAIDALDRLTQSVNELKSSDLYGLITIVLGTFNISLDNVVALIAELQTDVNEVFGFFTGATY